MGQFVSRDDFHYVYDEEPHATRRTLILKQHPEIKTLFRPDPMIAVKVLISFVLQMMICIIMRDADWPALLIVAYTIGGTIAHSLTLANHEIAHNLAFGHKFPLRNRALGMFANLALGVPGSVTFKKYHLDHHRYQGDDVMDVDIPTAWEGRFFNTTLRKFIWCVGQPFFYTIRPFVVASKPLLPLEVINLIVQSIFNCTLVYFFGAKTVAFLFVGTFSGTGLHPMSGHFIAEHYVFVPKIETYSYYGPLNILAYNVGYHNEHHDFPYVPGCRLPDVRRMAPEWYDNLPTYNSWVKVIYDYITDPAVGPFSRIKRRLNVDDTCKKMKSK